MQDIERNIWLEQKLNDIHIRVVVSGYARLDKGWHNPNYKEQVNTYHTMYYVKNGKGRLVYNGTEYKMVPGKMYFVPMGLPLFYSCDDRLDKVYFHIEIEGDRDLNARLKSNKVTQIPVSQKKIDEIYNAYEGKTYRDVLFIRKTLLEDVIKVFFKNNDATSSMMVYSDLITDAIKYIKENLYVSTSIHTLAKELNVSEYTLQKLFKKEVGKSVDKFIDELVMTEANTIVLYSDMPIGEISAKFGFCDQFYFSNKFKKVYGCTPMQRRTNNVVRQVENKKNT